MQIETMFGRIYHVAFLKDPSQRDFIDIDLTLFFGLGNFGITSATRVIFFFENVQNFN